MRSRGTGLSKGFWAWSLQFIFVKDRIQNRSSPLASLQCITFDSCNIASKIPAAALVSLGSAAIGAGILA
jgi:hypothetical protein